MSKFKEDEIYSIFKEIGSNKRLKEDWEKELLTLKNNITHNHIDYSELYIKAYNNIKK